MFNVQSIPPVTKNLLIINVVCFVITYLAAGYGYDLNKMFGVYFPLAKDYFKPYQVITHMFMHGGISHLFFNMFALWMFGSAVENYFGPRKYLILYFAAGLGAYLLQSLSMYLEFREAADLMIENKTALISASNYQELTTPMVGASGCIFGVLVAFGVLYPNTPLMLIFLPIPIKAKYFIAIYIAIELFSGINPNNHGNVAHFAHIGGAIVGYFLTKYWMKNRYRVN